MCCIVIRLPQCCIRQICHLSTEDLPQLRREAGNKTLTANKFDLDVDPVAVVCQAKDIARRSEEWLASSEDFEELEESDPMSDIMIM